MSARAMAKQRSFHPRNAPDQPPDDPVRPPLQPQPFGNPLEMHVQPALRELELLLRLRVLPHQRRLPLQRRRRRPHGQSSPRFLIQSYLQSILVRGVHGKPLECVCSCFKFPSSRRRVVMQRGTCGAPAAREECEQGKVKNVSNLGKLLARYSRDSKEARCSARPQARSRNWGTASAKSAGVVAGKGKRA